MSFIAIVNSLSLSRETTRARHFQHVPGKDNFAESDPKETFRNEAYYIFLKVLHKSLLVDPLQCIVCLCCIQGFVSRPKKTESMCYRSLKHDQTASSKVTSWSAVEWYFLYLYWWTESRLYRSWHQVSGLLTIFSNQRSQWREARQARNSLSCSRYRRPISAFHATFDEVSLQESYLMCMEYYRSPTAATASASRRNFSVGVADEGSHEKKIRATSTMSNSKRKEVTSPTTEFDEDDEGTDTKAGSLRAPAP